MRILGEIDGSVFHCNKFYLNRVCILIFVVSLCNSVLLNNRNRLGEKLRAEPMAEKAAMRGVTCAGAEWARGAFHRMPFNLSNNVGMYELLKVYLLQNNALHINTLICINYPLLDSEENTGSGSFSIGTYLAHNDGYFCPLPTKSLHTTLSPQRYQPA